MVRYISLLLFIGLAWGQTGTDLQNKLDSLRKELEGHKQKRNIKIQEKLDSLRKAREEQKQERNIKIREKLDTVELVTNRWMLFGEYDLIVRIQADDESLLTRCIVEDIRTLDGVIDTRTLLGAEL